MPTSPRTKAVLLSALVCPGAGQLYLGRRALGAVLVIVTVGALATLLVPAVAAANEIAGRIVAGELRVGPELAGEVQAAATAASASSVPATAALAAAWVAGIAHAWVAGRRRSGKGEIP